MSRSRRFRSLAVARSGDSECSSLAGLLRLGSESPALRRASNCLSTPYNCQENEGLTLCRPTLCRPERPIPSIFSLLRIIFGLLRSNFSFLRRIFSFLRSNFSFLRRIFFFLRRVFSFLRSNFGLVRNPPSATV